MSSRLVAIVLHGGGSYYLDPLFAAGRVPHIASLLAEGTSRTMRVPYPISASAWVTMFTGEAVGTHGVIDCVEVDARNYHAAAPRLVDSRSYRDRTIFSVLSAHGRRVASLYLPMTYPPWPVDGIMVSGFPLPDERRPPTWPPDLAERIEPLASERIAFLRYGDTSRIEAYLADHLDRIVRLALDTVRDRQYDAVFACLAVPDLAHHYFWRPDDPEALERIYRVYERVDAAIGEIVAATSADDHVVLFSDHGGCPAPRRAFAVNRWLADRGWLVPRGGRGAAAAVDSTNRAVRWARRHRLNQRLGGLLPLRLRDRVSAFAQNDAFVDWSHTRAYGMSFFYPLCGISVNLRGRQAQGIVSPGPEQDAVLAEVREGLQELRDPETGTRVCRRVVAGGEWFDGPAHERFPDLVAELDHDYDARPQLEAEAFGPNTLQWEYPYLGYHYCEGLFAVRGPGIRRGVTAPAIDMIDLPPTLLALLGLPAPSSMQGRAFEA